MKRLLLLCLTAAVLVSCLGLSAQAAPTLSWTEFYTMGDAASAHTRIDPIELDGTTTLLLPASVSRKAVPVYFTLSEKNAVVTATGSRGSVALKSGDTLDLTALCEGTDDMITLRARSGSMQAEKRVTFLRYDNVSTMFLVSDGPVNEGREWVESSEDKSNRAKGSMALLAADGESVYDGMLTQINAAIRPGREPSAPIRSSWTKRPTCSRPATAPIRPRRGSCWQISMIRPLSATCLRSTSAARCRWSATWAIARCACSMTASSAACTS